MNFFRPRVQSRALVLIQIFARTLQTLHKETGEECLEFPFMKKNKIWGFGKKTLDVIGHWLSN